jgi:ribonuclease-3
MPLLNYKTIEKRLGIRFKKHSLLKQAFIHSSYLSIRKNKRILQANETLEFLGDAVLELVTREYFLKKFPEAREGALNELKKMYTNTETLYKIGKRLGLGEFLIMDKGEKLTGGRNRQSNIAGCLEAIIGALYLDRGLLYVQKFIHRMILTSRVRTYKDCKSLLNLWAMRHQHEIVYSIIREVGPPHRKMFHVALLIDGKRVSQGKGASKKEAEQRAARIFLKKKSISMQDN